MFSKIVAPSMFDAYGGSAFPGIGDILYNINEQVKKNTNNDTNTNTNTNLQHQRTSEEIYISAHSSLLVHFECAGAWNDRIQSSSEGESDIYECLPEKAQKYD